MDKYLNIINQIEATLKTLKQEKLDLGKQLDHVKSEVKDLKEKINSLAEKIDGLEKLKKTFINAPKFFRKKKIENLLFAIGFAGILVIMTLTGVCDATLLLIILPAYWTGIYFCETYEVKVKIKGCKLEEIEQQISEALEEKEQLEKEYILAKYKENSLEEQIKAICDEIVASNQELASTNERRKRAIEQILSSLLEQQISDEENSEDSHSEHPVHTLEKSPVI